jgi:hypothetical protein
VSVRLVTSVRWFPRERAAMYSRTQSLWGGAGCDEAEATVIREWCELIADVPMGYGRVGHVPTQLTDDLVED